MYTFYEMTTGPIMMVTITIVQARHITGEAIIRHIPLRHIVKPSPIKRVLHMCNMFDDYMGANVVTTCVNKINLGKILKYKSHGSNTCHYLYDVTILAA